MTLQEELTRIWEAKHATVLFVTHDVDEAVFLANRVVVLSARPAAVKEVVEIPLPRPRSWTALVEDAAYKRLVARVLSLVRRPAG
jgi:NitT/TauT family transport system ATP-binding protein